MLGKIRIRSMEANLRSNKGYAKMERSLEKYRKKMIKTRIIIHFLLIANRHREVPDLKGERDGAR